MAVEMMKSLSFFEKFSKNYKILPALMASDFGTNQQSNFFTMMISLMLTVILGRIQKFQEMECRPCKFAYERFFDRVKFKDRTTNFIKITTLHKSYEVAIIGLLLWLRKSTKFLKMKL